MLYGDMLDRDPDGVQWHDARGPSSGRRPPDAAAVPDDQQAATAAWLLGQTIYAQANILAYRDGFPMGTNARRRPAADLAAQPRAAPLGLHAIYAWFTDGLHSPGRILLDHLG